jgi:hypothetical protein
MKKVLVKLIVILETRNCTNKLEVLFKGLNVKHGFAIPGSLDLSDWL